MNRAARLSVSLAFLSLAGCQDLPVGVKHDPPAFSANGQGYVAGQSYFGENQYIEYIAGNLPVIFTAAHGGSIRPAGIPLRTAAACGGSATTVLDSNTQELTRAIRDAFFARTGRYPHIVINRLHRDRLDANRNIGEAACGNALAETAWHEFHDFIEHAKSRVIADYGRGWYTDVHGHGHTIQRLELGYSVSGARLRFTDSRLDSDPVYEEESSIRVFSQQSPLSFSELLRGPTGLGTLFEHAGFPSVPSMQDPAPASGEDYFSGGYNTDRHGCRHGGQICGVQIEANMTGVRDNAVNRARFAAAIVDVYEEYLWRNFGIALPVTPTAPTPEIIVDNSNDANDPTTGFFTASGWSTGTNMQSWGANFALGQPGGTPTQNAEFYFFISAPGTYHVDAWWPAQSGRSDAVAFQVYEREGGSPLAELFVNQRVNGQRWNRLGTYHFGHVGWARVLVSRALTEGGSLAADAVRITAVTASNRPPTARFDAPSTALEGGTISVDGTRSSDLDGDALTWSWSFGDGNSGSGATTTHSYARDGTYTITLTVTDGRGGSATATRTIAVANVAPQVQPFAGATILRGETYSATGTFTDPGADTWTATVDYGAGVVALPLVGRTFSLSHTYNTAGTFTVTVTVHDGAASDSRSAEVRVLSTTEGFAAALAAVDALLQSGRLSAGNANSLTAKLDAANAQAQRGNATPARAQLDAFAAEVDALLRAGRLDAAAAAELTQWAERLRRSLVA